MRLFFLLLLLLNLAFFFWHEQIVDWLTAPPAPERPAAVRGDAPPRLVLLSERNGEKAREAPQRPAASAPRVSGGQETASPSGPDRGPAAQTARQEPAQRPMPASDATSAPVQQSGARSATPQAAASRSAPARSVPPREQTSSAGSPASPSGSRGETADPGIPAGRCMEVGPYLDLARAEEARTAAERAGLTAALETAEREVPTGYWVLTQGRYDLAGAREVLQRMNEDGIGDTAIVSLDSGMAISLGLYSRAPAMERRRRELMERGYTPEVRQRFETRTVHLLRLKAAAGGEGAMQALLGTLSQTEPRLEWREAACP